MENALMINPTQDWNPRQARMKQLLRDKSGFAEAIRLCLELHGMVHFSEVAKRRTMADELWEGLSEEDFAVIPRGSEFSIAWYFWHVARIEDLTVNLLIAGGDQILDDKWMKNLGACARDTGNAMDDDETIALSRSLDKKWLRKYRNAVGLRTRSVVKSLKPADLKRKVEKSGLDRILAEGGVLEDENSVWLLDFWGKKDVGGLLMMPVTRHQLVHLNDCAKIRKKIGKGL